MYRSQARSIDYIHISYSAQLNAQCTRVRTRNHSVVYVCVRIVVVSLYYHPHLRSCTGRLDSGCPAQA